MSFDLELAAEGLTSFQCQMAHDLLHPKVQQFLTLNPSSTATAQGTRSRVQGGSKGNNKHGTTKRHEGRGEQFLIQETRGGSGGRRGPRTPRNPGKFLQPKTTVRHPSLFLINTIVAPLDQIRFVWVPCPQSWSEFHQCLFFPKLTGPQNTVPSRV